MKKILLSLIVGFLSSINVNGQALIKKWDFSTITYPYTESVGITAQTDLDGITLIPAASSTNFGVVAANSADFGDGFISTKRFQFGGSSGGGTTAQPTNRYMYFPLAAGTKTIKIWLRQSGTSARTFHISNGNTILASYSYGDTSNRIETLVVNGGETYNLYCEGNAFNIYKIEIYEGTLSTTNIKGKVSGQIFSSGKTVFLRDLKAKNAELKVFNLNGGLVKSVNTSKDIQFDLNSGLYLVTLKTNEGEKSVKLSIK